MSSTSGEGNSKEIDINLFMSGELSVGKSSLYVDDILLVYDVTNRDTLYQEETSGQF